MRGGSWFLRVTTLVAALAATAVFAQEGLRDRNRDIEESRAVAADLSNANFHNGPFYILSSFELSDIGYNQAFFVPTAEQTSGVSFNIRAPQKLYFVPQKKVVFSVDATPSYAIVSHGNNQLGYYLRTDARLLLNHLFLDGYVGRFNELRANIGDINRLVTQRQTDFGVIADLKYSSRTTIRGNAGFSQVNFPSSRLQPDPTLFPLERLARDQHDYRVALQHKTFPLTSLVVSAERSDYNFKTARSSDSRRSYAAAGFSYDDGRHSLSAEAGPARLEFNDPAQRDFRGVLGSARTTTHLTSIVSFSASVTRDLDFSLFRNNNYYVADRFASELNWTATRRLSLHLLGNYGRDRYDVLVEGIRRRDTLAYVAVGWLYGLKHISGGFDIGYFERKSNSPLVEVDSGIRGTLRLSLRP